MDFVTIITSFFTTYQVILLSLFALGLANTIAPSFSFGFGLFSIFCFVLFFVLSLPQFGYFAIAGIVIAFILKWLGY